MKHIDADTEKEERYVNGKAKICIRSICRPGYAFLPWNLVENKQAGRNMGGTRVKLISMDDTQAPPNGTMGSVINVDDIGTIHVAWDNGSSLGLIPGVDMFVVI